MKKKNYLILHFLLSFILISFGVLLELKGTNTVPGFPHLLFVLPGTMILLGYFLDKIQLKKNWYYLLLYLAIDGLMNVVVVYGFKMTLSSDVIWFVILMIVLSSLITWLFHMVYDNLKHPGRLLRL